jgi:hypothetical protein
MVMMGKLFLLHSTSINQDEFYYLSRVHDDMNNRLTDPFQNFHVHFFQWVNAVGQNEVTQIKACRMVMFLFFSGTCLFIYLIGKRFTDRQSALFSVLCYLCFMFTLVNGAGFRSDTLATFFFLFSLYLFFIKDSSVLAQAISGLAMAVAILFTIKSAIYMVVFLLLFFAKLILSRQYKQTLSCGSIFFMAFFVGVILFYQLHVQSTLPPTGPETVMSTAEQVKTLGHKAENSYSTFISIKNIFPQFGIFKLSLQLDWRIWLFLFAGFFINLYEIFKNPVAFKTIALLVLFVPMLSLLFYKNAFPYFYVFMIPTAIILCGVAIRKVSENTPAFFFMMFVTLAGSLIFVNIFYISYWSYAHVGTRNFQEQTLDVIHQVFPYPVPYIDGCAMVASFPNAGFFMSSAGMKGYLKRNTPVMKTLLEKRHPLFLLANVPHLNLNSETPPVSATGLALLQEDWDTLRSNYTHHWGNIWIIGKQFQFTRKSEEQTFDILIPGQYSISSTEGIYIDGRLVHHNDSIYLSNGSYTIKADKPNDLVKLKIGAHPFKPDKEPENEKLFLGSFM